MMLAGEKSEKGIASTLARGNHEDSMALTDLLYCPFMLVWSLPGWVPPHDIEPNLSIVVFQSLPIFSKILSLRCFLKDI